jgi:hypothetical protein
VNPAAILIPVLVAAAGFAVFCLVDIVRAEQVRYLPKWGWAILCLGIGLTIPWGGIIYLLAGKVRPPKPPKPSRRSRIMSSWPMWRTTKST